MTKRKNNLSKKNRVDPKYLGVPNICFSLTPKNDEREKKYIKQRIKRGFDDSETWSLTNTIANFILPRLDRYMELADNFINLDYYRDDIFKFKRALELISRDKGCLILTKEEEIELKEGLEAFPKIFMALWW